eukprot:CAMPEP_0115383236 /NCGR_PEP_ID=MMETSP0271-20121206/6493_1 /TAXON_ID=71861 /ORGANISM="Scrippsiella trochoidea, Strain CCMP3099" /LENGTH=130 /DNA_ID=CAMNT_0002806563 /DNA_START=74 /DNA_END=467 /DNA_ORIENTATION=-
MYLSLQKKRPKHMGNSQSRRGMPDENMKATKRMQTAARAAWQARNEVACTSRRVYFARATCTHNTTAWPPATTRSESPAKGKLFADMSSARPSHDDVPFGDQICKNSIADETKDTFPENMDVQIQVHEGS